jgi:hypothetical protein
MKRSPGFRSTPTNFSKPAHRRLSAYALAASATGVTLLALAPPSDAEVVYTPADQTIGRNSSLKIDLNHDGITDFTVLERSGFIGVRSSQLLWVAPAPGNHVNCTTSFCASSFTYAAALRQGSEISSRGKRGWLPGRAGMAIEELFENGSTYEGWGWVNVTNGYLGLQFQINGETHFGWARFTVQFHGGAVKERTWEAHLTGYAYETVAGQSIKAGQTTEEDEDAKQSSRPDHLIPGPSPTPTTPSSARVQSASLGALALGASGLALWRREESAAE